jgi:hypothetical protein
MSSRPHAQVPTIAARAKTASIASIAPKTVVGAAFVSEDSVISSPESGRSPIVARLLAVCAPSLLVFAAMPDHGPTLIWACDSATS